MNDEKRQQIDDLIDLFVYAPVGLVYEYKTVFPQLVRRGKSQVQLAKVLGQMAVRERQARSGQPDAGGPSAFPLGEEPMALFAQAVARGITEVGAALGLAPTEAGRSAAGANSAESTDRTDGADHTDGAATDERPQAAAPDTQPLPIAGYETLPAREVIPLLADLDQKQRQRIRSFEEAHRARKTVLAKLDRLDEA